MLVIDSKVNYLSIVCCSLSKQSVVVKTKQNRERFSIICVSKADIARITFKDKWIHILQFCFPKIHSEAEFLPCQHYKFLFKLKLAFLELIIWFPLAAAILLWTLLHLSSFLTCSVGGPSENLLSDTTLMHIQQSEKFCTSIKH